MLFFCWFEIIGKFFFRLGSRNVLEGRNRRYFFLFIVFLRVNFFIIISGNIKVFMRF